MKVHHTSGRNHTILVCPGFGQSECPSDWKDDKGGLLRFEVKFDENGTATVDNQLGEYLIEKGYAQRTALRRAFGKLLHA